MPRLTIRRLMAVVVVAAVLLYFVRVHYWPCPNSTTWQWSLDVCRSRYRMAFRFYVRRSDIMVPGTLEIGLINSDHYGLYFVDRPQGTVLSLGHGGMDPYNLVYGLWLRKDF